MKYILACLLALSLTACGTTVSTPFVAPTRSFSPPGDSAGFSTPAPVLIDPLALITPQVQELPPAPTISGPCASNLKYLEDISVPDGTIYTPGQTIDKRWRVQNNGDCNWDSRFRLRLISGTLMGAVDYQPLVPATAGAEAIIRILFTAPFDPGVYQSEWQAVTPDGQLFGEAFYMEIVVQ